MPHCASCRFDDCEEESEEGGAGPCQCQECCEKAGRVSGRFAVGGPLHFSMIEGYCEDEDTGNILLPWNTFSAADVTWVQSAFKWQLGAAGMAWGNEPVAPQAEAL